MKRYAPRQGEMRLDPEGQWALHADVVKLATVPKLLAACESLVRWALDREVNDARDSGIFWTVDEMRKTGHLADEILAAEAAIAKMKRD